MSVIHVGIGGWDYEPWRETFYPPGLSKKKQLEYVGQQLTATEINATYYKLQRPELFAGWAKMVPDGFKFAVKASRFATNRKNLGEGGEAIGKFCAQGFTELGDKLGPILWQLAPTKKFDPEEIRAFLMLLPTSRDGIRLRHALEVRHESFRSREFVAMARAAGVAIVYSEGEDYPAIADVSGTFTYARLQCTREDEPLGHSREELDRLAARAKAWARGESPAGLPYVADPAPATARDSYLFFIAGAKARAPAAAMALMERL